MSGRNWQGSRVVITGVGVISPIGNSVSDFWTSLTEGRSGVVAADAELPVPFAGLATFRGHIDEFAISDPQLRKAVRKSLKLMNRETQMGLAAAQQALAASGLTECVPDPERIGVCFGAGNVAMMPHDLEHAVHACCDADGFQSSLWGTQGLAQIEPLWLLKCLPNMPACHAAIVNDLRGPNNTLTHAEAAFHLAMGEAVQHIQEGTADLMLVGGTGTTLHPVNLRHFTLDAEPANASFPPDHACRPFDRDRTGAVPAEGAAAFVIESLESAVSRGAATLGEVHGTASSCVISPTLVPDARRAVKNVIGSVLKRSGFTVENVGYVHAHGLGTVRSDAAESAGIHDALATGREQPAVLAMKGYTGNAGAGSGALELAGSVLSLQHRCTFPALNFRTPDDACPVRPERGQSDLSQPVILNLSLTAQGLAGCTLISAFADAA
ncbi:MAG: beta-ketoacyl-[acyl-carrier-protein] synthase family protein [Planctomycetaceae bacterium]|nr:beta-ketoacyl-[acyl-carrier-protein] synthase family protein [Planctomycetaceae bacterium]